MTGEIEGAEGTTEPIRVLIVDDHPVWRDGLRTDLEASEAFSVVGEASDGGDAIDRSREAMPDVVIMDLHLPTVSGMEATRRIVEESPHVKVLILSATGDENDVLEAVFTPSLAGLVLDEFRRLANRDPGEPGLTARENEILRLVAKGYTYREIGQQLFIATKTVQNHVQNILTKLQLRKRYELMRYAIQRGLDRGPE